MKTLGLTPGVLTGKRDASENHLGVCLDVLNPRRYLGSRHVVDKGRNVAKELCHLRELSTKRCGITRVVSMVVMIGCRATHTYL